MGTGTGENRFPVVPYPLTRVSSELFYSIQYNLFAEEGEFCETGDFITLRLTTSAGMLPGWIAKLLSAAMAWGLLVVPASGLLIRHARLGVRLTTPFSSPARQCYGSSQSHRLTRLSFKTFDEMLVELEVPVLVDFYAQWCGPCKMMVPVLEDIAARMESDIKVAKVDTDRSPTLGHRYQVEALPTLILFHKGQPVERYVGYMSADELERAVNVTLKRIRAGPK